jgi:hypothetical protein
MKPRMQNHVQPRESGAQRNQQVREEIENFLRAVDSYPECAAEEPSLSFRQHLSSFFTVAHTARPRRH